MKKLLLGMLVLLGAAGCRAMRTEHLYQKYPGHQVVRKRVDQKPHYVYRSTTIAGRRVTRRVRSGWRAHYVLVLKSQSGAFIDVAVNTRVFNEVREGQVFPMYVGAAPPPNTQSNYAPAQQPPPPVGLQFCANCGVQLNAGTNFCNNCGQKTK
ncbi:MAG: zinc ribbon domain-containing protein [Planctomycetota bacterium]